MNLTLSNGATLSGTAEQLQELAKTFNIDVTQNGQYYLSESKGLVEISSMEGSHLKNALLKRLRARYETLVKEVDLKKIFEMITTYHDDKVIISMLFHLDQKSKVK